MNLVLGLSGATGGLAAKLLVEKSSRPVTLVASRWGKEVYARECGPFERLLEVVDNTYEDDDLGAPIASGATATAGMVILPCSSSTLAKIAVGMGDTLITRAAHCHLKEGRKLVLGVRETPWALSDIQNAKHVSVAGGIVMPMAPPFYTFAGQDPKEVSMEMLLAAYVDRVLAVLEGT